MGRTQRRPSSALCLARVDPIYVIFGGSAGVAAVVHYASLWVPEATLLDKKDNLVNLIYVKEARGTVVVLDDGNTARCQ